MISLTTLFTLCLIFAATNASSRANNAKVAAFSVPRQTFVAPIAPVRPLLKPTACAHGSSTGEQRSRIVLNMSAEEEAAKLKAQAQKLKEEAAALAGKTVEEMEAPKKAVEEVKKGGDLYDDEVAPYKDPLSDAMKDRLRREASTGLDYNAKQTNVLLYIMIGVAVLVILGGKGILY